MEGAQGGKGGQKNRMHVIHYCHLPANHAASAVYVHLLLLFLLLWDTWSPTAKKDTTWQPTRKCHLCLPANCRSVSLWDHLHKLVLHWAFVCN